MTDLIDVVTTYLETWNEREARARQDLLESSWASRSSYVDPMAEAHGRDEIDQTIAAVQQQFGDYVFTPLGEGDVHHRQARLRWGLGPEGGEPVVIGFDVLVVDEAGQIERVYGFLDRVPDVAD